MKHFSTSTINGFSRFARRGALLLALGAAGPAVWGQSFGPPSFYPTGVGSSPRGVALADLNSDGRLDIVLSNYYSINSFTGSSVGVLLGQSGGGFTASTAYPTGPNSYFMSNPVLGDVDLDGQLDVVEADYGTGTAKVLRGQRGILGAISSHSTGSGTSPYSVALGDVNGDGVPDLVTANYTAYTVSMLLGQTGGSFTLAGTYPTGTGSYPTDVKLADINRDGRLDIALTNGQVSTLGVMLGQAGGVFGPMSSYPIQGGFPVRVMLRDINGDGYLDALTTNNGYTPATTPLGSVAVLLGQAGGFAPGTVYYTGAGSVLRNLALGDVNGDGMTDIVVADSAPSFSTVKVLLGQAGGIFATPVSYAIGLGTGPWSVALGDVNGDGRLDIVAPNSGSNDVAVLLNTGTYTPLAARPTAAADVALSPNPAHDAFTVTLPAGTAATSAELLNALGQVVRRPASASPNFRVETSGLAPGVYTLRLLAGEAVLTRRVAVE